jgi:hypothetical protein
MATAQSPADWRNEWFEIDDATYCNTASRAPMARAVLRAAQASLDASRTPHRLGEGTFFDVPNRCERLACGKKMSS